MYAVLSAFSIKKNLHHLFYRPEENLSIIDGLRALSIILVVIAHLIMFLQLFFPNQSEFAHKLPGFLRFFLMGGALGVNVFFVISGFLIGRILLTEYKKTQTIRINHFYIRRFLRLMPVYWLGLVTGILLGFPNVQYIWANLLYVTNFLPMDHQFLGWTWSLAVEEQFYFIFPLLILFLFRFKVFHAHTKTILILVFLLSIFLNIFIIYYFDLKFPPHDLSSEVFKKFNDYFYIKPYSCFIALFSGVVVAYIECYSEKKEEVVAVFQKFNMHHITVILALLITFLMFFVSDGVPPYSINPGQIGLALLQPLFAACIAYLIFYTQNYNSLISRTLKKLLSLKIFYVIAQLSYSAYIFHLMIIVAVYHILKGLYPFLTYPELLAISTPIVLFLIFITSSLCYLLLERPIMNLRKK